MSRPLSSTEVLHIHETAVQRRAREAAVAIVKRHGKKLSDGDRKALIASIAEIITEAQLPS